MIRSFANLLDHAIGRCPRCMRKAFLATIAAWPIFFVITAFSGASWMWAPMLVAAVGLTALWLAHIGAFALRTTMAARHATLDLSASKSAQTVVTAASSRRQFVAEFARTAAVAAVATALSARANTVLAAGTCDCSKCRSDQVCCRTANGYCGCFPKGIQC
jgi:hypothetical protein